MRLRRAVKQQARRELKGRLWQGVLVFFLWGLAWGMVSFLDRAAFHLARSALERFGQGVLWVTIATMGLRTLLLVPLEAGVTTWFAALVQGWTRPLTTVFWAYGNRVWLRSLGVRLHAGLVSWGTALIPLAGEGFSLWLLREKLARLPPRELMLALGASKILDLSAPLRDLW